MILGPPGGPSVLAPVGDGDVAAVASVGGFVDLGGAARGGARVGVFGDLGGAPCGGGVGVVLGIGAGC